uniref:VPS35 endosomal protein-sorting factor-like n=1 Tax=Mastacembelus armatus TaxID=205130 RepID=A0A7N8YHA4_9TELE
MQSSQVFVLQVITLFSASFDNNHLIIKMSVGTAGHSLPLSLLCECHPEVVPVDFGDYHPLKPIMVTDTKTRRGARKGSTSSSSSSSSSAPPDPLSSMLDGTDPLSMFAAASASETPAMSHSRREKEDELVGPDFEPWPAKRGEILARFTTTEKLSIVRKAPGPGSSAVSEKVRTRLEELDDLEEGSQRELLNLSQQDYANRIEELNQSLKEAWASDQKVKALKIVIQCSKLLSDTSVIQFYPSKFVLITDILDTFGRLVYDRIWTMCSDPRPLPDSFTVEDVNDTAKETCLNWFFKIASIRELLPRLYVEAAILKCNRFLNKTGIQETLTRLTAMIRGIGDPLVAAYARAYLCRIGMEVAPHLKDSLNCNFFDLLGTFQQISGESVRNQLVQQRVEVPEYLTLYSPAISWILQCIAYRAPEPLLTEMMERCKKLGNNALLLNSVMRAFRPEFVAARATDFIAMIKECDEAGFPKHLLFGSLGRSLACADPPESERLTILNEAWKVITKVRSPQDYVNCAEIWVEFTCRNFTKREVNTVLADIIKHMTPDRAFEDAYPQVRSSLTKVSFGRDFEQQLSFCVEARATFCNLEPVLVQLIHMVNQLAMETRRVMRGSHSRKTASFVRACAAYSYITIPSLSSIFSRLSLYLLSGQVALANQCLSQADAFLKAAVSILPEVPRSISVEGKLRSSESFLLDFISNFLATLLVVPDHPEHGVLYLVRGLLNMVQDYTWEDNSDAKVRVYISALPLLAAMSQETYLYSIPKVDSNETLYGGDPKFLSELNKLCDTLIGQILDHLKALGRDENTRRQGALAFSLFAVLLAHGDLRNNKLSQLAINLWNLSHKHGYCETRISVRTLDYIKHQAQQPDMAHLSDTIQRLALQSRT